MREDKLIMRQKERIRKSIIEMVLQGYISLKDASIRVGISYRHILRIVSRYRAIGDEALVHKSRGKVRVNKKKEEVLGLYRSKYEGFGPTLFGEKLAEEGYSFSRETLRIWLKDANLHTQRRKRSPYRTRRERRKRFGELIQMDGSIHHWLEGEERMQCLLNIVDDATGKTMALLGTGETTEIVFRTLQLWIEKHGIPREVYVDLKSLYVAPKSLLQDKDGQYIEPNWLTHFSRACKELGIKVIKAYSPQAKGRVERNHAVYQDRFVKELKLRGVTTIDGANELLLGGFIDSLNNKFMKQPQNPEDAHIPLDAKQDLNQIFSWQYERSVSKDYVVRCENRFFQLARSKHVYAPACQKVTVKKLLDGTYMIYRGEIPLQFTIIGKPNAVVKPLRTIYTAAMRTASSRKNKHHSPWSQYNTNWLSAKPNNPNLIFHTIIPPL